MRKNCIVYSRSKSVLVDSGPNIYWQGENGLGDYDVTNIINSGTCFTSLWNIKFCI